MVFLPRVEFFFRCGEGVQSLLQNPFFFWKRPGAVSPGDLWLLTAGCRMHWELKKMMTAQPSSGKGRVSS